MKFHTLCTRYPLVAAAAVMAALIGVHPGGEAADAASAEVAPAPAKPAEPQACGCRGADEAVPVADDPRQPLDPRDPQFIEKQARRYRIWLHQGAASAPARS